MVEVIENKAIRLCRCQHCNSLLRYMLADIAPYYKGPNVIIKEAIRCPACGKHTHIENVETAYEQ